MCCVVCCMLCAVLCFIEPEPECCKLLEKDLQLTEKAVFLFTTLVDWGRPRFTSPG